MRKKSLLKIFTLCGIAMLTSCSSELKKDEMTNEIAGTINSNMVGMMVPEGFMNEEEFPGMNNDEYLSINEVGFIDVSKENKSTFSLDSSSASYSNIRSYINNGYDINADQVIIEQMINYFDYDYKSPVDDALAVYNEVGVCPWNSEHKLASIAIKSKEINYQDSKNNNYVLLIDVSGSMSSSNKLPYVKKGFSYLLDNLNDDDIVSVVTYSGKVETIVDGEKAKNKQSIISKINSLVANGSTAGGSGIQMAYELATKHFIQDGNNQILLATDGDFNVGVSSIDALEKMVKEKQESGINLSCFGFGMGNYKDHRMQTLALNGNGNVFYIDCETELEKTFTGNISSILQVVAKDSKIQVTFNEETCSQFRLIGYENKIMSEEQFNNEQEDAGEIYSNKTVIALYEIVPTLEDVSYFTIDLKYKDAITFENKEILQDGNLETPTCSNNHIFASCVAQFAMLLRNSAYKGNCNYSDLLKTLEEVEEFKQDYLKNEFIELVKKMYKR